MLVQRRRAAVAGAGGGCDGRWRASSRRRGDGQAAGCRDRPVPLSLSIPTEIAHFRNCNAPMTSGKPHHGFVSTPRTHPPTMPSLLSHGGVFLPRGSHTEPPKVGCNFSCQKSIPTEKPCFARLAIVPNDDGRDVDIARWKVRDLGF